MFDCKSTIKTASYLTSDDRYAFSCERGILGWCESLAFNFCFIICAHPSIYAHYHVNGTLRATPAPRPSVFDCPLREINDIERRSAKIPSFGIKYRKVYQLLRLIMQAQSAGDPVKYKYFDFYVRLKQTPSTLSLQSPNPSLSDPSLSSPVQFDYLVLRDQIKQR